MDRLSLPKDKIRVLLLEGVNDSAADLFAGAGYANVTRLPKALDAQALRQAVKGVHLLGIRSRTRLTEKHLRGRRPPDRGRLLQRRHQPGRSRRGAQARHPGLQRPVLEHPQRGRTRHRRNRHALAPHRPALGFGPCGRVGQVRPKQFRSARQDARHRRLRQHRLAALDLGRGHGHAGHLLRPDRQAAPRQHGAGGQLA